MIDPKKIKTEVPLVANRLHAVAGADAQLREASLPGIMGGAILWVLCMARSTGMGAVEVHALLDAVDNDFAVATVAPEELIKLVRGLLSALEGTTAKVDPEAVKKVDEVTDAIIAQLFDAENKKGA